jgi:hypothetical protein
VRCGCAAADSDSCLDGDGAGGISGVWDDNTPMTMRADTKPVVLEISSKLPGGGSLFHPFTTTLVEISLDREPYPFNADQPGFLDCCDKP